MTTGFPLVQKELARYLEAASLFLRIARGEKDAPGATQDHQTAIDILSRDIRRYTAAMFTPEMQRADANLLASLIEEEDFTASLGESLFQVARRVERQTFSAAGRPLVDATLDQITRAMRTILTRPAGAGAVPTYSASEAQEFLLSTRERCLSLGTELSWEERGAILELLGSAERAFFLIHRIDVERASVPRPVVAEEDAERTVSAMHLAPAKG